MVVICDVLPTLTLSFAVGRDDYYLDDKLFGQLKRQHNMAGKFFYSMLYKMFYASFSSRTYKDGNAAQLSSL